MNKTITLLLLFVVINASGQNNQICLIPQPVEIQQQKGAFTLSKSLTIRFDAPESGKTAEMLAQKLNVPTGFSIKAQQGNSGDIQFNLNKVPVQQIGNEGYSLVS